MLLGRDHWLAVAGRTVGAQGAGASLAAQAEQLVPVTCDGDARDTDTPAELAGRGILSRIVGDLGSAGGSVSSALGDLSGCWEVPGPRP